MAQSVEEPKQSKRPYILGCCGGGCLVVIIGVIGVVVWSVNFVKNLQEPTPTVTMQSVDKQKLIELQDRYVEYKKRVKSGKSTADDEFILTEDEINNYLSDLLVGNDVFRAQVRLKGDVATGELSIPREQGDGTTKWINGEAEFTVELKDGQLDVRLKNLELRDKRLFDLFMKGFQEKNLADDLIKDKPELKRELEKIENFEIKDGKVHLQLKPQPGPVTGPEPDTEPIN